MAVGISLPRIDARAKVTGQALYPGDLTLPGMAHAKVLFARRPHARVKSIDLREALALPGVIAIFTGADVPNNEYGLVLFDAPVMVSAETQLPTPAFPDGKWAVGSRAAKPFDGVVRHVGEKLAFIVAETERIAERARDLIRVEYDDLPPLTDMHAALQPDAPQIHPHYPGNVMKRYRIRKGDVAAAFAQCDVIVEDIYTTGAQEHAYLQPEAGLAYMDGSGCVTVQVAGQWAHEDQHQIAHALGLPLDQVRVIYPAIGGAFGGREDMSVQIVLALAAWKLRRPVKIVWTREESIIGHHKRHPMWFHAKLGATRDGRLLAAQVEVRADAGPYAYTSTKVLGNTTVTCVGPYEIPNVAVDACAVVTNNVPSGAFRGFGAPQALFVAETQMNKLAEKLGMDPIALRLKNALRDGSLTVNNTPIPPGCTIADVIARCAAQIEKEEVPPSQFSILNSPFLRRGRGFACGHKNVGFSFGFPERCEATVELHGGAEIERAVVRHAGAECGQGAHTAFLQLAAEMLHLPVEKIELVLSDTATSGSSGSASASRLTFMAAHAIQGAIAAALDKWRDEERPAIAHYVYRPRPTTPMDEATGQGDPNITYGYVAQYAEVAVDVETGHVRVQRIVCADDVGRAVNPQQVIGQIEGGVVQALGWTSLENFVMRDGHVLSSHFSTYLIPSVLDVPDRVEAVLVENPDPQGVLGIRGMAEMPFLVVAPAVIAAIHDATGVWINDLPVTPERLRRALKAAR
ncbi:xanthine dehydrogenase family protein molybdopterin-binding subunit [Candidatus Roseilinea sp. NK_OTU-006]|jgi:CO/xanthine dehydrogenase Mo-binding subunit|uniref:xanthine dehydrogenase family protein molybdopterin-binding subunit n=1 Tax=Candidatus Roseilinea sp. NK_OTU-006 TaxID=2704250 RepID=UPI00145F5E35|nr:xanthine dehydrogenase family protein molybdopterin-binding subunit [Candidatus Roseilinea sp. NK_OTU-006]